MNPLQTLAERRTVEVGVAEVEAALLEGYPALVRLVYLVLPAALGRHRRVLAAHGVVQRAVPDRRRIGRLVVGETDAGDFLRRRVLAEAIRQSRARTPMHLLPQVWGLRLFPRSGAADDFALDQAMAACSPQARAAWALVRVERLEVAEAERQLEAIGVREPAAALREAAAFDDSAVAAGRTPLTEQVFDPCAVRLAPTDLMRRRARGRAVAVVVTSLLALVILVSLLFPRADPESAAHANVLVPQATSSLTADSLHRTGTMVWRDTARLDFSAWPARGSRVADRDLLNRALAAWTRPTATVTAVAGVSTSAPVDPPQLLYAGDVDGAAVVLLHDGLRLARFTDRDGGRLVVSRADDTDETTAGAVAISETPSGVRFLTAPWVAGVGLRDLKRPDAPPTVVPWGDGVTAPVAPPTANCSTWPALQLTSSKAVADGHTFLLTPTGGLSPTHLTYLPPAAVRSDQRPQEATSGAALVSWSRTACTLQALQDRGVKSAGNWTFAEQRLPDGTVGSWVCTRSDSWAGGGWARVQLFPAGLAAGQATDTAICSRFDRNVLATTAWRSPTGTTYLLAAGSQTVDRLTIGTRTVAGSQAALAGQVTARVSAHVTTGDTIGPLNK